MSSAILSAREREIQGLLRQKDADLKQANAELEERGKLLYKTKVAIEQLQAELTASRKEEQAIRDEAQRICDDQAAELRRAEEQLQQMEAALMSRNQQAAGLQAKVSEMEAELDSTRQEQRTFGSVFAAKERDQVRKLESLQDEVEHQKEKVAELERLLKERSQASTEQKDKVSSLQQEREEADRVSRDLGSRNRRLADENQHLEQQLSDALEEAAALRRQLADSTSVAEQRTREKAAADKEWGRRLGGRDKELAGRTKELGKQLHTAEERGRATSKLLADAEAELGQANGVWQRRLDEAQGEWGRQVAELEASWEKRAGAAMRDAEARLVDETREWERRLRDCEAGWRSKLAECESTWGQRYAQERQQWEHDRSDWEHWRGRLQEDLDAARTVAGMDLRKSVAAQLAEADGRAGAERAGLERSWAARLESSEAAWSQRLEAEQRTAAAQLEEAQRRGQAERAAAEEKWAQAVAEAEGKWRRKLDELRGKWSQEQAAADTAWAARLEEAHSRWLREKSELERVGADRVASEQELAAARYDSLRGQLEGRVAAVSERLAALTAKEGKKEAARKELKQEAEALRCAAEEEFQRRVGLERTLHEAATLFRRELSDKNGEMRRLQGQVHRMRRLGGSAPTGVAGLLASTAGPATQPDQLVAAAAAKLGDCWAQQGGGLPSSCVPPRTCASSSPCRGGLAVAHAAPAAGAAELPVAMGTCCSCPCSPSAGPAAAGDLSAELAALRAARSEYASAVLEQDRVRNSLLCSLGERLRAASPAHETPLPPVCQHTLSHFGSPARGRDGRPRTGAEPAGSPHFDAGRTGPCGHGRGGYHSCSPGRRCCSSAGQRRGGYGGERSSCSGDEGASAESGGGDRYRAANGSGAPFLSWQEDLSHKLGNVMRKLHM